MPPSGRRDEPGPDDPPSAPAASPTPLPSGWWRRIPTWIKGAGAAIIMLGAVATALNQLGIIKDDPPVSRGELSDLRVAPDVTLGDFKIREQGPGAAVRPEFAAGMRLVAELAQESDPDTATPESEPPTPESGTPTPESGTPTPESGTPTPESGTPTPESGTPTPESGTPTPESGTSAAQATLEAACGAGDREPGIPLIPGTSLTASGRCDAKALHDAGLFSALSRSELPPVAPPDLPETSFIRRFDDIDFECVAPIEGQVSCVPDESFPPDARTFPDTEEGKEQAARFAVTMLKQVRARSVGRTRREAVGALVTYDVRLIGFDGERVTVGWSLWTASKRARLPENWMFSRRAAVVEADRQDDSASDTVWIPLPRDRGPYFIRLSLYDAQGIELDNADTPEVD